MKTLMIMYKYLYKNDAQHCFSTYNTYNQQTIRRLIIHLDSK